MTCHCETTVCATFQGVASKVARVSLAPLRHLRHPPLGVAGDAAHDGAPKWGMIGGWFEQQRGPPSASAPPARTDQPPARRRISDARSGPWVPLCRVATRRQAARDLGRYNIF